MGRVAASDTSFLESVRLMSGTFICFAAWFVVLGHVFHVSVITEAAKSRGKKSVKHGSLDTFASCPEREWFNPSLQAASIANFMETWAGGDNEKYSGLKSIVIESLEGVPFQACLSCLSCSSCSPSSNATSHPLKTPKVSKTSMPSICLEQVGRCSAVLRPVGSVRQRWTFSWVQNRIS